jgi:hypothetical protein
LKCNSYQQRPFNLHQHIESVSPWLCIKPVWSVGKVSVSWQGICGSGEILPWNEMGGLIEFGGIFAMKQIGTWRNWSYVSLRETPNLRVLEALIDYIHEEQIGD